VAEVAVAGGDHRQAEAVCRFRGGGVLLAPSGVGDGGRPGGGGLLDGVREGEEAVGAAAPSGALRRATCVAATTLSTRLICPAPTATTAPSLAKTTALERTCFTTRQAKRRSASSDSLG